MLLSTEAPTRTCCSGVEDISSVPTVKPNAWYADEETTDADSCASDVESTCSSDASTSRWSGSDASCRSNVQVPAGGNRQRILLPGHLRLSRSGRGLGKGGRFGGTPLESIPGSPNKATSRRQGPVLTTSPPQGLGRIVTPMAVAPSSRREPIELPTAAPVLAYGPSLCLRSPRKRARAAAEVQAALATGAVPPTTCCALPRMEISAPAPPQSGQTREHRAVLSYTPAPPSSPKKRARAAILAQAQHNYVPLKVELAKELGSFDVTPLDPMMPAKKVPSYGEFASATETAFQGMTLGLPVKKRVPAFLLKDPPLVVYPSCAMPR